VNRKVSPDDDRSSFLPAKVRLTRPVDAPRLRLFSCSTGPWYEQEVEDLVRGTLADHVEQGFQAWVAEDESGQLAAVAAHVPQSHPENAAEIITYIALIAARADDRDDRAAGPRLRQLIKAVFADILRSVGRGPYVYQMVAVENSRMRGFLEWSGFQATPVPSDSRYLYYSTRVSAPLAQLDDGQV
jgi:hypothetical protein